MAASGGVPIYNGNTGKVAGAAKPPAPTSVSGEPKSSKPAPAVASPAKSGTNPKPKAPAIRGHWVAGNDGNWVLIHAVGPGKWVQGAVKGAKAPPKPKGNAPPPNNPMEPWGNDLIREQATKEITGAYAPQQTALKQQQQTAQNIYQKQQADNEYYTQWATSQAALNQQQTNQVQASTNQVLQGMTNPNQLTAATAVNGEAGQNSLLSNTINSQAATNQNLENQAVAGALQNGTAAQNLVNSSATNYANDMIQASAQKELGTFQTAQNAYSTGMKQLGQSEAADITKEIVRLQGVQTQKAEYQQSNQLAAQKLNLTGQLDASTESKNAADAAATTKNAATAATNAATAQYNALTSRQNANTNSKNAATNLLKAQDQKGLDAAEINRDNAAAKASIASAQYKQWQEAHPNAKSKAPTAAQTATVYGSIDRTRGAYQTIVNNGYDPNGRKLTDADAYQILKNGGKYYVQSKTVDGKIRYTSVQVPRIGNTVVSSTAILNAAANLSRYGHINSADLRTLNNAGIFGVRGRYAVGGAVTTSGTLSSNFP